MRSVSKRAAKSAPQKSRNPQKTAEELEQLIAERFGVQVVQVSVRGQAPDWSATLIASQWQRDPPRGVLVAVQ